MSETSGFMVNMEKTFDEDGWIIKSVLCGPGYKGGAINLPDRGFDGKPVVIVNLTSPINTHGQQYDLVIPDTVHSIAGGRRCSPIRELFMGKNVKTVWDYAFERTFADKVYWPNSCDTIPEGCFNYSNIKQFVAGDSLERISYNAFTNANIEILDLRNVLMGDELSIWPATWGVKEIIPPFYGKAQIVNDDWIMCDDGVIRKSY